MKNQTYFFQIIAFGLLMVLFSCGEKDEPQVSPIVGIWNYSAFSFDMSINGQPLEQFLQAVGASAQEAQEAANEIRNDIFSSEDFEGTELQFNADGTYEIRQDGNFDESGTYELLNGETLLRLTSEDEVTDFEVKQLTANSLTILLEEEESDDFFGIGLPVLVKLELELSFVK